MRSLLDELNSELRDLHQFVNGIKQYQTQRFGNSIQTYLTIRKRFDHAAFSVTLYRTLEKFVEELVEAYAQQLANHIHYDMLPKKLKDMHLSKTIEILSNSLKENSRHANIDRKRYVNNLNNCLTNANAYQLNHTALSSHTSNVRKSVINNIFASVGIESIWEKTYSTHVMSRWCSLKYSDVNESTYEKRSESYLEEIVQRRTQVTHYVRLPENLCSH